MVSVRACVCVSWSACDAGFVLSVALPVCVDVRWVALCELKSR
jgi:hypothetical protein